MTLHQLTHSAAFEIDLGVATALRRLLARAARLARSWTAHRRLDHEMARLDHRELSDIGFRK
ncbi:MAG: hypothetical protein Q7R40_03475 [Phaeospirillum sp.]|nr:hypothetical protein [Phaeospirillum sp.]